jgi:hypothetical protein
VTRRTEKATEGKRQILRIAMDVRITLIEIVCENVN